MFIIGLYGVTREIMTKTSPWLSMLSELAMPFYLTHQQLLIMIVAGVSGYPYLSESSSSAINPQLIYFQDPSLWS